MLFQVAFFALPKLYILGELWNAIMYLLYWPNAENGKWLWILAPLQEFSHDDQLATSSVGSKSEIFSLLCTSYPSCMYLCTACGLVVRNKNKCYEFWVFCLPAPLLSNLHSCLFLPIFLYLSGAFFFHWYILYIHPSGIILRSICAL